MSPFISTVEQILDDQNKGQIALELIRHRLAELQKDPRVKAAADEAGWGWIEELFANFASELGRVNAILDEATEQRLTEFIAASQKEII